jgi:hypothetical protein
MCNETLLIAITLLLIMTMIWIYFVHQFYLHHIHDGDDMRTKGR